MSQTITVLLFGPPSTLMGVDRVDLAVDRLPVSAADLLDQLKHDCPALAKTIQTCRLAVNHDYTDDTHPIGAGDEVALIGPVSGG